MTILTYLLTYCTEYILCFYIAGLGMVNMDLRFCHCCKNALVISYQCSVNTSLSLRNPKFHTWYRLLRRDNKIFFINGPSLDMVRLFIVVFKYSLIWSVVFDLHRRTFMHINVVDWQEHRVWTTRPPHRKISKLLRTLHSTLWRKYDFYKHSH